MKADLSNKGALPEDVGEQEIDIPVGGSLELLALGDVGLLAWREKRREQQVWKSKPPEKDGSERDRTV